MENLQFIIDELGGKSRRQLTEVPAMADLSSFGEFLKDLKNQGMNPHVVGEFSMSQSEGAPHNDQRPYLVK